MDNDIEKQREFWNREITVFDSIYSHQKSGFAAFLDRVFRKDMYQRYEYTLLNAEPIAGRTFLDIGCGTGRYSLEFARRKCKKVVGIDIAEAMIRECRDTAAKENLGANAEFVKTDLLNFTPQESFDVSIGIGLFDYIKEPLAVMEKMRQCTAEKSIMSFPRLFTWRAPVRKIRLGLKKCDVYFYSKSKVDRLLRSAGFSRFSIEKVGKLFCVTAYC
jgi:2-polyprenyl-3-methyl-5-hydroxy-6-metoxy-1,4-benzoquinol methylase